MAVVTINRENYTSKFFAECCGDEIEVGKLKAKKVGGKPIKDVPSASGNAVKETKGDPKTAAKKGWKPAKVQVNNSEQYAVEHRLTMNAVRASEAPVEMVELTENWGPAARAAALIARRLKASGAKGLAKGVVKGAKQIAGRAIPKSDKARKAAGKAIKATGKKGLGPSKAKGVVGKATGGVGKAAGGAVKTGAKTAAAAGGIAYVAGHGRRKRKAVEAERRYKSGEREAERQHEKEMSGALSERARLKEAAAERKHERRIGVTRKERQQEAARERKHEQRIKPARWERMKEAARQRKHELKLKRLGK